jgi:hypothetical protein
MASSLYASPITGSDDAHLRGLPAGDASRKQSPMHCVVSAIGGAPQRLVGGDILAAKPKLPADVTKRSSHRERAPPLLSCLGRADDGREVMRIK